MKQLVLINLENLETFFTSRLNVDKFLLSFNNFLKLFKKSEKNLVMEIVDTNYSRKV
jgi:hypothetical protein